jgi:hypothetical protein
MQHNINVVDNNDQCTICKRWFREGGPMDWHMKTVHGPDAEYYHKLFSENAKRVNVPRKRI